MGSIKHTKWKNELHRNRNFNALEFRQSLCYYDYFFLHKPYLKHFAGTCGII